MKTVFIGIRDGLKDGEFSWGADFAKLTKREVGTQYRPYWIAEIPEDDWYNWLEFQEPSDTPGHYTGRNLAQWDEYWQSKTTGPIIQFADWEDWKVAHGWQKKVKREIPATLKERAIKLCEYGAKHGSFMVDWVRDSWGYPADNVVSVVCDAHNEAKRRNPDICWIYAGSGPGSYEAYHKIRTERPELTWEQIWDFFESIHDEKKLWEIAADLIREDYKPLKKYPKGYWGNGG